MLSGCLAIPIFLPKWFRNFASWNFQENRWGLRETRRSHGAVGKTFSPSITAVASVWWLSVHNRYFDSADLCIQAYRYLFMWNEWVKHINLYGRAAQCIATIRSTVINITRHVPMKVKISVRGRIRHCSIYSYSNQCHFNVVLGKWCSAFNILVSCRLEKRFLLSAF